MAGIGAGEVRGSGSVAAGGVRVDETVACVFTGSGAALQRLLEALSADDAYQAVQVAPDRLQFARTFRPTWALVVGVITLPLALVGVFFLLVKTTETCLAVVEADHRGTRVRLSGKLSSPALGRVRIALTDGVAPTTYVSTIGQPVASAFAAGSAPLAVVEPVVHPMIDLRVAPGVVVPTALAVPSLSLLPPPYGLPVATGAPPAWPAAPPALPVEPAWEAGTAARSSGATLTPDRVSPAAPMVPVACASPAVATVAPMAPVAPALPTPVAQPVTVPLLVLDDGKSIELAHHNLLGRDPVGGPEDGQVHLIPVVDQTRSVSKTHLSVSYRDAAWKVVDRHSTNGAAVVGPDGTERPLRPGELTEVPMGSSVRFGGRSFRIVAGAST